jgi:Cu-Zn family superoxide dismutase
MSRPTQRALVAAILLSSASLGACSDQCANPTGADDPRASPAADSQPSAGAPHEGATIELTPVSGSSVKGEIRAEQREDGVWFTGDVQGLSPGPHGIHIHEKGDCSAPDAKSAGAHFEPATKLHGAPTAAEHHAGDMGNIEADADGTATVALLAKDTTLTGERAVLGRALIIHSGPDDFVTQPSGNSGAPVACGVIRKR